jgi:RNA polymerase sigma-70 factor (ECF subfamily)
MAKTSADELIPTRMTLIQRLKDWQDQSSWQDFFDTYWKLIYGVALKGGLTPSEAEDVVQETIISVAKHMPNFKYDPAIGSFKAWLLNMTRWRITDQLRKRRPEVAYQEFSEDTAVGNGKVDGASAHINPDLDKLWDAEWDKNLFDLAITKARRHLSPKQYQIFDFSVNREWAPKRVAKALNIPVDQVYVARHRVSKAIKEEFDRLQKDVV